MITYLLFHWLFTCAVFILVSLSHLVFRVGYGIRLFRFLIIAFLSTWHRCQSNIWSSYGPRVATNVKYIKSVIESYIDFLSVLFQLKQKPIVCRKKTEYPFKDASFIIKTSVPSVTLFGPMQTV